MNKNNSIYKNFSNLIRSCSNGSTQSNVSLDFLSKNRTKVSEIKKNLKEK